MTGAALDLGSMNDVLRSANAAENLLRSADDEFRNYVTAVPEGGNPITAAVEGGGTTRDLMQSAGPVSDAYMLGYEPVMLITGPGGSSKTTSSVKKAMVEAQRIYPGTDGVRRYVLGVWRQKYVNLWKATIPSWWSILPKNLSGSKWYGSPPRDATHVVRFEDAHGLIELIAHFRAFGDSADPQDLKGNQFTDVWLNEMDTLPEELFTGLADRIGRDPPFEVIRRHGRIFGDANAPSVLNYTYRDFYENPPEGYKLYRQPGGRHPDAENIRVMGRGYYEHSARINKHRPWWVRVMVDAKPGYLRASKPVYPKYDDDRNVSLYPLDVLDFRPIVVSCDGGATPAAAYMQEGAEGQLRILAEIQLERGGMKELANAMLAMEAARFPNADFLTVIDPSAKSGEETDDRGNTLDREDSRMAEGSERQRLAEYLARKVKLAKSQEVSRRIAAVADKFDLTLEGGEPGVIMDPSCKGLRRGFNETFRFRTIAGTDDTGAIQKTFDGHVHEALQYGAMELGSDAARQGRSERLRARQDRQAESRKAGRYNPKRHSRAGG